MNAFNESHFVATDATTIVVEFERNVTIIEQQFTMGASWDGTIDNLTQLKVISISLMVLTIAAINLAMGALFNCDELRRQVRLPTGILVGCCTQFIVFPALALCLTRIFSLPDPYAVGMMVAAVSPSSSISNLFTFFVDGNICLSVAMTLISTLVSIGMIPSMLFILTNAFSMDIIKIPFFALFAAALHIIVPMLIGLVIHHTCKPKWTRLVITISLAIGFACYITNCVIQILFNQTVFIAPLNVYSAMACLPAISYVLGYVVSLMCGQDSAARRSLGLSIVFHNISITILSLSTVITDKETWYHLTTFPTLYGTIVAVYGFVGLILYHVCCPDEDNNQVLLSEYQVLGENDVNQNTSNSGYRDGSAAEQMALVGRGGEYMRMESMSVPTVVEERRNTSRF